MPAQGRITGLILRQQHNLAMAARIADKTFQPDDRLHAGIAHFLRELQRAKHVVGVGDCHRRLRIGTGKRRDRLQTEC